MTQLHPLPDPPRDAPGRTIARIIGEALLVLALGGLALGISWELQYPDVGWVIAGIIWVLGAPALEISRLLQSRR